MSLFGTPTLLQPTNGWLCTLRFPLPLPSDSPPQYNNVLAYMSFANRNMTGVPISNTTTIANTTGFVLDIGASTNPWDLERQGLSKMNQYLMNSWVRPRVYATACACVCGPACACVRVRVGVCHTREIFVTTCLCARADAPLCMHSFSFRRNASSPVMERSCSELTT